MSPHAGWVLLAVCALVTVVGVSMCFHEGGWAPSSGAMSVASGDGEAGEGSEGAEDAGSAAEGDSGRAPGVEVGEFSPIEEGPDGWTALLAQGAGIDSEAEDVLSRLAGDGAATVSGCAEAFRYLGGGGASSSPQGACAVVWQEGRGLVPCAEGVLEEYRELDGARVAASGYLDVHGNVWAALVELSGRRVDMVVVVSDGADAASAVKVVRLDARAWGEPGGDMPDEEGEGAL